MRTIPAGILTAQQQTIVAPRHALIARSDLLSFASFANSGVSIDTQAPASWAMKANSNLAYVTFRTDWREWVRVIDITSAGAWALTATGSAQLFGSNAVRTMRSGVFTDNGGSSWLYTATASGSAIQVQRASLSGTSNPLTVSLANYGPTFGPQLIDSGTLVRRVEAVCPTDGGVVVAVGSHRFDAQLTTVEFYWLPDSGTALMLNALIQMPLTESYSAWQAHQKSACAVQAIYNATTKAVIVVANAASRGYGVAFTIKNGVESEMRPVAPFDIASESLAFTPSGLSKIGSLYYLAGRFSRSMIQDKLTLQVTAFDCYLTSADGEDWSFGERNFFLQTGQSLGALLMRSDAPAHVYYGGNGLAVRAPITPAQHASASTTTITDDVIGWTADCVSNGADTLAATLADAQTAGGGDAYSNHAHIKRGGVVTLRTGQEASLADFGVYGIDTIESGVSEDGQGELSFSARDYGSKRLIDTNLLVEALLSGRIAFSDLLTTPDAWDVKTPDTDERDVKHTTTQGLVYEGLNDPIFMHAVARASQDGQFGATVRFNVTNGAHLSSLGFVFGASDEGQANVMLLPKSNTWTGHVQNKARVRRLNLPPIDQNDPDKIDTGYNLRSRMNALWEPAGGTQVRTTALAGGAYRADNAFPYTPGTDTDVRVRVQGRRVQIWAKTRSMTPASCASNAAFQLLGELVWGDADKKTHSATPRVGLTVCTDVWGDSTAFAAGAYDDLEQSLTYAANSAAPTDFTAQQWNCTTNTNRRSLQGTTTPSHIIAGQYVRLSIPTYDTGFVNSVYKVASVDTVNKVVVLDRDYAATPGGNTAYLFSLPTANIWGYADCGKRNYVATEADELGDLPIPIDPKAKKRPRAIRGRGIFISDDNTAAAIRMIETDGVRLNLRSGAENGTRVGWDLTNPIAYDDDPFYSSGSDPSVWRAVLHHGYVFAGSPATYGMPLGDYIKVGDEAMRYMRVQFFKRGMQTLDEWTIVPAWYAPLAAANGPTTTLRNWRSSTGAQPGDDLGRILTDFGINPVGLLVDVVSKSGGETKKDKQHYVQSATFVASPNVNSTSYITLDSAYENDVRGPDPNIVLENGAINPALAKKKLEGDLAVLSGRGQFGTDKEQHDADAPVVYYPCDTLGNPASIYVRRFSYYAGRFQSVQDAIKRLAAIGGMRESTFRNAFTTPTADVTTTLSTTPYTLPLQENVSNFTLDMNCHLPGNNTNSGGFTNAKRLNVYFRDYYRLTVQLYNSASDIAAGRLGNVRVGLATTKTSAQGGVDANVDGDRWLEVITVPVSDYNLSGSYSGSNPNYAIAEDVTRNIDLRVSVHGALVQVDIGGQPVYTFNLDDLNDGTNSYRRDTAAPVQVEYSVAIAGNTATIRVQELGDEVDYFVARRESSVAANISEITDQRRIKSRATQAGGVEFSQFRVRDNLGTMGDSLWGDKWARSDTVQTGHLLVASGDVAGEALDTAHIVAEGYRFGSASNDLLRTVEAATMEARLLLRDAKEMAEERGIAGVGFIQAQAEDRMALAYDPVDDVPAHASTDHVISGVRFSADDIECTAEYTLRGYQTL